jgi:photosystem II stability/assembly factor-like uncharacterized protein
MISRRRLSWWSLAYTLVALGPLAVAAVPSRSSGGELTREQQIADLERQITELTKRRDALKAQQPAPKEADGGLPADWVKSLNWRPIGPASMGGRIVDFAVCENDPNTYWVATASGGLLKTVNNGTTFEHQFDREATVSIGAVAVAPSDPNVVWVGTGENNPRNSVSWGDGVYKSTDGGKTWKNMGLKKSFQIGHIVIHPTNPNVVYVGALGRLYGPGGERGLFKTNDGGQSWERVWFLDDKTGIIDVKMNPANPEDLIVAAWERQRDGFDSDPGDEMPPAEGYDRYDPIKKWGAGSGLYKTSDGGKTFRKLTAGLPTVPLGRIGLDYYRKDPRIVFAILDSERIGTGRPPSAAWLGVGEENISGGVKIAHLVPNGPAAKAGLKEGDVLKSIDKKELHSRRDLIDLLVGHKDGDKLVLSVERGKEAKDIPVTLERRPEDQGGTAAGGYAGLAGEDSDGGVRVRRVEPDSPAAKAGLQLDDLIKSVDKKDVRKFSQLAEIVKGHKPDDKLTLAVQRGKDAKEVGLTLGGPPRPKRPYSFWYGGQRENVQDDQGPEGVQCGGLYKSQDGGESWTRINSVDPRPMYFSQVRVDPNDEHYVYVLGIQLYRSKDGGATFTADGGNQVHPDQHALWIDPRDGRHMLVGCDGGFYATYDRMDHWDFLNTMAIGQFYCVAVDSRHPYRVYGGLQDNGTWGITSHSLSGPGPNNDDAVVVGGGDGFQVRVDPTDPDLVYFESQDGHMARRNLRTGQFSPIRPRDPNGKPPYRFNWNTPFILSGHNAHIFYCGGNYVFRSVRQGDDLRPISSDITRTKRGSASALAESPRNPEVLWAGTDDGYLWVTRDGGAKWENVTEKVGLPGPRWVASIEASRAAEGRAYVVFDGHRSDDEEPYVFVTEDFGQTWKPLRANLPAGSTRVLREDVENQNLLFLGTEFAVWASLNRGESWTKINNNLPTVAVLEFAQHPTAGELVGATHGRSLWVLDVTALRQMTPEVLKAKGHLFRPATATRWRSEPQRGSPYGSGSRHFVGENPPAGAQLTYALTQKAAKVGLKVLDYTGRVVKEWPTKDDGLTAEPGLHRISWNLLGQPDRAGAGEPRRRGPRRGDGPRPVPAGMYRVVLTVDGQEQAQGLRVEVDPLASPQITVDEEEDQRELGLPAYRITH